jgi:hypothetical protein
MPGLLDARGGFNDPITMGLLGASQALLTPMSQGGGLGAAFGAFPAAQQAAEANRYKQMLQAYQMRKMQQEDEDRQTARDLDAQIKAAARNSFVPPSPGSLGGGVAPGSQQGQMLLANMSGDTEFDSALLQATNSGLNTVGPKQSVSLPTQGGFDQGKFFNNLMQVSPLQAMKLRKDMQADSPWAKINPGEYTPDSVAAFAASNNPAVLRKATGPVKYSSRDTGTTIEYFPEGQPDQVVHRVLKARSPSFSGIATEGGGVSVIDNTTGLVQDARTLTGDRVLKPLKELPATVANGYIENQVALNKIDEAITEVQKYPNALGLKNLMGDAVRQRTDPEGVAIRAMIADIGSMKIHDRSGAAVSAAEFPRLKPFVPSANDEPAAAVEKLKLFKREYELMQQGITTFYSEGYKQPPTSPAPAPTLRPASAVPPQAQPSPAPQPPQSLPQQPTGLGTPRVEGKVLGPKPVATQADVDATFASMRKANPSITRQQVIDSLSQIYRIQ